MTRHRIAFVCLLSATAVLYLWNLSSSGWANSFYSAAVQAGSQSWKAFFFGSSDAANAITVDKTPAALWVMGLSARLFGMNSWSVLVPQAIEGVAAVAVLYATVRRIHGPAAGLLAGGVLAVTPVATLMFRFNNPDALLVLLLVVGAYCVQRACENRSGRWWLPLAGAAVGLAFLTKMAQTFLVLPGFALAYLVTAHAPLRARVWRAVAGFAAMVVSAGWYLAVVALWPADRRPYIGGSQHNSILELALGYNGFGRLTGDEPGGLGNPNHDAGWGRLLGFGMGTEIAWLIPAALICLVAALVITRREARTDAVRGAGILWGSWLLITGAVISYSHGIIHPYYTVALAPAIAACIGIGAPLLWRRRDDIRAATALSGMVVVTTVLACVLLARDETWLPWLRAVVAVAGVGAAVLLLLASRLPDVLTRSVAVVTLVSCLAGPAAYAVATAAAPHQGAIPSAGPSRGFGFGGPFDVPDVSRALAAALSHDADHYTWTAATVGSTNAAGYQLATHTPVMAIGGFNGTDPSPTLTEFQTLVSGHKVHYFIDAKRRGPMRGGAAAPAGEITAWVKAHFPATKCDGVTLYDLS